MLVDSIFGGLAGLSVALLLWQWLAARRFPLHRRIPQAEKAAGTASTAEVPITLLKPLAGCDVATEECLRSWLAQDYPGPVQVLFGVASAPDPACNIVQRLQAEFPAADAQLIVCGPLTGTNPKAAKLAQLEPLARGELLVISDADVRAPADLLRNLAAGFGDPGVGLVNCFYCLANPSTPAMYWEAVAINADFWSQVLQSLTLKPMDFALGAVIAVRRACLKEISGFGALSDCLADDYQLGNRIARRGHRIALCPVVAECREGPQTWVSVWKHQVRWARTIRVSQPVPYFFSMLSNPTLWPALWLSVSPSLPVLGFLALCLALRAGITADLMRRLTAQPTRLNQALMAPLKDLLQAAVWVSAFLGRRIEWRGEAFLLRRDGTLEKVGSRD